MSDLGQIPAVEQGELQNTIRGQFLDGWRAQRRDPFDPGCRFEILTQARAGDHAAVAD